MSVNIHTIKITFLTEEQLLEKFEDVLLSAKNKETDQLSVETLHGHSSFNFCVAPYGLWWLADQDYDTYEEWIERLSDEGYLNERLFNEMERSGVKFGIATTAEFDGDSEELGVYTMPDLLAAKEEVFESVKKNYKNYIEDVWEEYYNMI